VITLTVGSPPPRHQVKQVLNYGTAASEQVSSEMRKQDASVGEKSSIRVAIPAQLEDFRERNDQSIAATEQNKASVVSNPKISSMNSSSAEARRIESQ